MKNISTFFKTINKILLWFLILLCVLATTGLLNFGLGLGNMVYVLLIIGLTLIHIYLTRYLSKKNINDYWILIILAISLFCILIVYKSTIGRGPEYDWNGKIFYVK